jgi:hypothetical protein
MHTKHACVYIGANLMYWRAPWINQHQRYTPLCCGASNALELLNFCSSRCNHDDCIVLLSYGCLTETFEGDRLPQIVGVSVHINN